MCKYSFQQKQQDIQYIFPYHYLDLVSDEYKYIWNTEYLSYLNILKKLILKLGGGRILDAGCGDGRFLYEMGNVPNVKLYGVDYSEKAIRFAKIYNPEAAIYLDDLSKFVLKSEINIIVCIETLEHIVPHKLNKIINNLYRNLKTGGYLLITVPTQLVPLPKKHYQHFNEITIRKLLEDKFIVKSLLGHSKSGIQKKIFYFLQIIGLFSIPFLSRINFTKQIALMNSIFFKKYLEICSVNSAEKLIILAQKK